AAVPYQVGWRAGVGLDWGGVNINVALGPSYWHFVQTRDMVDPGMRYRIAPPARNVTLINVTQNVTNYTVINNHVVDHGVQVEHVGRAVGHTIPHYRVHDGDEPDARHGGQVRGQDFGVFRPNPAKWNKGRERAIPPGHQENNNREQNREHDWHDAPPQDDHGSQGSDTQSDREHGNRQNPGQGEVDNQRNQGGSDTQPPAQPPRRPDYFHG